MSILSLIKELYFLTETEIRQLFSHMFVMLKRFEEMFPLT